MNESHSEFGSKLFVAWYPDGTRLAALDGHEGGWSTLGWLEIYDTILPLP